MPLLMAKNEIQSLLGIMIYVDKLLLSTTEVCESSRKLTSSKGEGIQNTYQNLYDSSEIIIKNNTTMVFYISQEQLNMEIDAAGVRLGTSLL